MKLILLLIAVLSMNGCNNSEATQVEGEPLLVREDVIAECDEKFEFKVTGGEDTNVSIEYKDTENNHFNQFGVDIHYDIVTPCPAPLECNTTAPETTIPSNDEPCPDGYNTSVSGSQCYLISATCAEGTWYDNTDNTCKANDCEAGLPVEPITPVPTCPIDTTLVGQVCTPDFYQPAYFQDGTHADCIKGYTFEDDVPFGLCVLDLATTDPVF